MVKQAFEALLQAFSLIFAYFFCGMAYLLGLFLFFWLFLSLLARI